MTWNEFMAAAAGPQMRPGTMKRLSFWLALLMSGWVIGCNNREALGRNLLEPLPAASKSIPAS